MDWFSVRFNTWLYDFYFFWIALELSAHQSDLIDYPCEEKNAHEI